MILSCVLLIRINHKINQSLSLCGAAQVALHELGHAIGLHHEQCRVDRDAYLDIHWWNVWPHQRHNFQRMYDTSNYSIPYDYCSIMQYGAWAFGMESGITILPKDFSYIFTMGEAILISFSRSAQSYLL
jgi:hypothetical protein